ncbi:MAG: excinuclease ABC subunit UvrA [Paludibacteraceae bacterium]|nr:excinuclease ABC subunit UvrA [Paludibacteraceae bacterium]
MHHSPLSILHSITVRGARVNNLKNIDVSIPSGKLVVITGVSGSGKSSLAFDTLYAEGQRRYVESLSSYARQFVANQQRPDVDFIDNLPPAIAVEQKVKTRNPRSTVGTSTEIYDYLKLLFARIGKTVSPVSGVVVTKHQVKDVLDYMVSLPEGEKQVLLAPIADTSKVGLLKTQGFSRVFVNGEYVRIDDFSSYDKPYDKAFLVIERFTVQHDQPFLNRMADSVETAFYEGGGVCYVGEREFSENFEADGIRFEEPSEQLFNFNSPMGACPKCQGFGNIIGIDENLVVPNKTLSVYEDAIAPWRGKIMGEDKQNLIKHASKFGFPIHRPYYELTPEQRRLLWTGNEYFYGLDEFFKFVEQNQYKIQYRVMLSRYRGKTVCPECGGGRLRREAEYVKVCGKSITELTSMSVSALREFFRNAEFSDYERSVAQKLLAEITSRLDYLYEVGLEYLTLNRASNTLSGGESQRINLATSLGSSLVGSLYILDEPSIGLHPKNTDQLIHVLRQLQTLGNTVVVVEHDENIIASADYVINIGPGAGRLGGQVVYQGSPKEYVENLVKLPVPKVRRKWNNYIEIKGATENNLKNLNVKFPLGVMTVVTGVSGSGKSTLVKNLFYGAVKRYRGDAVEHVGSFGSIEGSLNLIGGIELVDQNPIGKSSRSNPCIYLKAFDEIRNLFAEQQLARQMGFSASYFSFNSPGGRCEECQGEGTIVVPMQFMADVVLECEACHGKRYKQEILDVKYRGVNIYDVLNMTVNQAVEFFSEDSSLTAQKIVKRLKPLQDVGIGYIKLGQSSSTLSGGESQRVKLASILATNSQQNRIFIFDEPTTGLHSSDIVTLMIAFNKLIESGHTLIIIEHNTDVMVQADHIIDLGPGGGDAGGHVVFEGTPEELVKCKESETGRYLSQLTV